jgi:hypothetical protein
MDMNEFVDAIERKESSDHTESADSPTARS